MTRLQKKCLAGSVCFHGLIVVVLLVTAAFRSEPTVTEPHLLNLVNLSAPIVDRPDSGGTPVPAPAIPKPAPPAIHPAPPAPAETHPQPTPAESPKIAVKTPPKPAAVKPIPAKPVTEPAPTKRGTTAAVPSPAKPPPKSAESSSQAQEQAAAQKARRQRLQEIASALDSLSSSVQSKASPVSVAALSGAGGGEAFVSYDSAVQSAYYNAWKPEETTRRMAVAIVKIIVSRNGNITSSEFVTKSGDPLLDHSVQRALDAVKELPPFPPNAPDTERSYIIRFDPETKQSAG